MRILVIGGTGKVGAPLVQLLLEKAADVRVLTRSAERAAALPSGVEPVVADLVNAPRDCAAAFSGLDAVFMINRPTLEEVAEGLFAVQLAREAGVRRFVYQSAHRAEDIGYLPHVASKLVIQRAIMQSQMDWTLLCPNHFFQNDIIAKTGIEQGLYVQPIGMIGCSGVDARDIADAAAIVLTGDGHSRQSYNIVGPEILTGESCASVWSDVLGRPIRYVGDVDVWQERTRPFMPAWLNHDLGLMYRDFGRRGFLGDQGDADRVTALLGRPPRRFAHYVREQAAAWGM